MTMVNQISGRLSLRQPQCRSLEILGRITEIARPTKTLDLKAALASIQAEFPGVTDFEREFPSLCFARATCVGRTRLMGAFISYLHLAHGMTKTFRFPRHSLTENSRRSLRNVSQVSVKAQPARNKSANLFAADKQCFVTLALSGRTKEGILFDPPRSGASPCLSGAAHHCRRVLFREWV